MTVQNPQRSEAGFGEAVGTSGEKLGFFVGGLGGLSLATCWGTGVIFVGWHRVRGKTKVSMEENSL